MYKRHLQLLVPSMIGSFWGGGVSVAEAVGYYEEGQRLKLQHDRAATAGP